VQLFRNALRKRGLGSPHYEKEQQQQQQEQHQQERHDEAIMHDIDSTLAPAPDMAPPCARAKTLFLDKFLTCPTDVGNPTGSSVENYHFLYQTSSLKYGQT